MEWRAEQNLCPTGQIWLGHPPWLYLLLPVPTHTPHSSPLAFLSFSKLSLSLSLFRLNIFGDFWVILTHFILGAEYTDQALGVNLDYTFFPVHKVFLPYFSVFVTRIKHMLINFVILLPNKWLYLITVWFIYSLSNIRYWSSAKFIDFSFACFSCLPPHTLGGCDGHSTS